MCVNFFTIGAAGETWIGVWLLGNSNVIRLSWFPVAYAGTIDTSLFVGNKLQCAGIGTAKTSGNELTSKQNKKTPKFFALFLQSFCRFVIISTLKKNYICIFQPSTTTSRCTLEKKTLVTRTWRRPYKDVRCSWAPNSKRECWQRTVVGREEGLSGRQICSIQKIPA